MRIHDINKSFNCNVCGATFNRRDSLHQHMKIHTKEPDQQNESMEMKNEVLENNLS